LEFSTLAAANNKYCLSNKNIINALYIIHKFYFEIHLDGLEKLYIYIALFNSLIVEILYLLNSAAKEHREKRGKFWVKVFI
jgi:hypothetical protein